MSEKNRQISNDFKSRKAITDSALEVEAAIKSGEKSTNDIRREFNLNPIPSDLADSILISKDRCNTHGV